jgi:Icc protein
MRIIQLTDLHIGKENEKPYDVDVRQNFLDILEQLNKEKFDLLVISGDLCFRDPDQEIYDWIHQQLSRYSFYAIIISGNHDSNEMINATYHASERSTHYFSKTIC